MEILAITEAEKRVARALGNGKSYELPKGKGAVMDICEIGGLGCSKTGDVRLVDSDRAYDSIQWGSFCSFHLCYLKRTSVNLSK